MYCYYIHGPFNYRNIAGLYSTMACCLKKCLIYYRECYVPPMPGHADPGPDNFVTYFPSRDGEIRPVPLMCIYVKK